MIIRGKDKNNTILMTSTSAAKSCFDKLDVDKKQLIIYENSAHYPQFEEKEQFIKWIKDIFIKEE